MKAAKPPVSGSLSAAIGVEAVEPVGDESLEEATAILDDAMCGAVEYGVRRARVVIERVPGVGVPTPESWRPQMIKAGTASGVEGPGAGG